MKEPITLTEGLNDVTNSQYHSDNQWLSSSNLKTLLKDPAKFYDEKILGNKVSEHKSVYDIGSYTHSLLLEPHLVAEEFAVFKGWRKQGKEYEQFVADNKGKVILSMPQAESGRLFAESAKQRPEAVELLSGGVAEQSLCVMMDGVPVKIRTDYINPEKGYIADIKTSGYPAGKEYFQRAVKDFSYDLSAALYTAVAAQFYQKIFDFYFIVISKPDRQTDVYKASSTTLAHGIRDVKQALQIYKQCKETGIWQLPDTSGPVKISDKYEIEEV